MPAPTILVTDPITPFESLLNSIGASLNAERAIRTYKAADLNALVLITSGISVGDVATVAEGGAIFISNGTIWQQDTAAYFSSTSARDSAYAKASSGYLVAGRAQCVITGDGSYTIYQGSTYGWRGPWALGAPFAESSGTATGSATGGTSAPLFWGGSLAVTFPTGRFTVAPVVQVTVSSAGVCFATVSNVTPTGCSILIARVGAYPSTTEIAQWTAIQMTPTSAAG